jgi:hypothetical protein
MSVQQLIKAANRHGKLVGFGFGDDGSEACADPQAGPWRKRRMKRHLWVEGREPPQQLLDVLSQLEEEIETWESWCTALEVMAELSRLGLASGFSWVTGSITETDGGRIDASWLEWGDWSIVTTAQWLFAYPTRQWRYASGAEPSLSLDHRAAGALLANKTPEGLS